jgi:hypothetical protein
VGRYLEAPTRTKCHQLSPALSKLLGASERVGRREEEQAGKTVRKVSPSPSTLPSSHVLPYNPSGFLWHILTTTSRFKSEMWAKIAEEMAVPWRAAEAMHWQLGEADMARRAGVVPFSLSSVTLDTTTGHSAHSNHRRSPPHGHSHSHSQGSTSSAGVTPSGLSSTPTRFHRTGFERGNAPSRSLAARRDSTPRSIPMTLPPSPGEGVMLAGIGNLMGRGGGGPQMLPSVSEMTTGVSPYNTPAYAVTATMGGGYSSPKPLLPSLGYAVPRPMATLPVVKRRASPDLGPRETSRRRQ